MVQVSPTSKQLTSCGNLCSFLEHFPEAWGQKTILTVLHVMAFLDSRAWSQGSWVLAQDLRDGALWHVLKAVAVTAHGVAS